MRLLVVEDEEELLAGLARTLREEGYAVDTAADGEDGLDKALAWDYDAILLDVMLPRLDGWELLRRLRERKKSPVLMLTARDAPPDRVRGLDGGADDYVVKPFDLDELLARLRALIRRAAGEAHDLVDLGEVVLDRTARRVLRGGRPVPLTPREYAVLEYLVLHRGRVVSRTELYDHLFDQEEDTLSNLVDVHVSNLRKKLGAGFVVTHRGHGYGVE
ncbi:MAG: response regulator transcription factor [Vicinamibacteria bacterium]